MQQRKHFTYRFEQLGPREATVFKSIVGLLDNRTHALWDHVERGTTDLLVVDAHVLEHPDHLQFDARVILGIGMLNLTIPLAFSPSPCQCVRVRCWRAWSKPCSCWRSYQMPLHPNHLQTLPRVRFGCCVGRPMRC